MSEWVVIEEFPDYEINREGIVRNRKSGRLKYATQDRYSEMSFQKDRKQYIKHIHVLLARAFIPNPMDKPEVNHIDGNKNNNSLYWSGPVDEIDGNLYGNCERPISAIMPTSFVSSTWFCGDGERKVQDGTD